MERIRLQVGKPVPDIAEQIGLVAGVQTVEEQSSGIFEIQATRDRDVRPLLADLVVKQGWGLLELRAVGMSMEEIFLELTTHDIAATAAPTTPATEPTPPIPPVAALLGVPILIGQCRVCCLGMQH